jgi:DNA repair protein RecO
MSGPINPSLTPTEQLKKGQDTAVPAIVLRVYPFRDHDLMGHLLTPSMGKISVIARHARGSRKRFPSSLDIFDRGTARLTVERSGAFGIKEFTPSHSLTRVRYDLDKLTLASVVCESFDIVIPDEGELTSPKMFELVDLSLNAIDEAADVRGALRATFIALATLTKESGIADISTESPGSRSLYATLDAIERFTERRLLSRSALADTVKKVAAA